MGSDEVTWSTDETKDDYVFTDEKYKLKVGKIIVATREGGEVPYFIKKIKKKEKNLKFIKREEENMAKFSHPSLPPLLSVFSDDKYVYHVFKGFKCENLMQRVKDEKLWELEDVKFMAIQLMRFLKKLHKKKILYLRPSLDNIFVTSKNAIKIYGLDSDEEGFDTWITKKDNPVTKRSDFFVLAEFIAQTHRAVTIEEFQMKDRNKFKADTRELIMALINPDIEQRKQLKLKKQEFFQTTWSIDFDAKTGLQVGDFRLDWSDGLCFGYGESLVGYRDGFYLESCGNQLTIGEDGFKFECDQFDISIGPDGLVCYGNKDRIAPPKRTKTTIDANGFHSQFGIQRNEGSQSVTLNENGLEYKLYGDVLTIGPDPQCTIDPTAQKLEKGMKDGAMFANVNDFFQAKIGKKVSIRLGAVQLKIDPDVGLIFEIAQAKIKFHKSGVFELDLGDLDLKLSADGLDLEMGTFLFKLKDTMRIEFEGVIGLYDAQGFHFENGNLPDISQYLESTPKITIKLPKIATPPTPPIPNILPPIPGADLFPCCLLI